MNNLGENLKIKRYMHLHKYLFDFTGFSKFLFYTIYRTVGNDSIIILDSIICVKDKLALKSNPINYKYNVKN